MTTKMATRLMMEEVNREGIELEIKATLIRWVRSCVSHAQINTVMTFLLSKELSKHTYHEINKEISSRHAFVEMLRRTNNRYIIANHSA